MLVKVPLVSPFSGSSVLPETFFSNLLHEGTIGYKRTNVDFERTSIQIKRE